MGGTGFGSANYLVGAGRVFFDDGNGLLDLGNIPGMSLTREITSLDHFAFVNGARQKDLALITASQMGLTFNIDEFNEENLNILMFGSGTAASNQAGEAIADEVAAAPILLDRSIFSAQTNITVLTIDGVGGTPTYVLDTDYKLINAVTGEIQILSTGSITTGLALELNYTSTVRNRKKIVPGADFTITGSCRIEFETTNGKAITWKINNASLQIEGDSTLDSENYSQAAIKLEVLVDKTTTPTEPFGAVYVG
jgi:hypothetical protein